MLRGELETLRDALRGSSRRGSYSWAKNMELINELLGVFPCVPDSFIVKLYQREKALDMIPSCSAEVTYSRELTRYLLNIIMKKAKYDAELAHIRTAEELMTVANHSGIKLIDIEAEIILDVLTGQGFDLLADREFNLFRKDCCTNKAERLEIQRVIKFCRDTLYSLINEAERQKVGCTSRFKKDLVIMNGLMDRICDEGVPEGNDYTVVIQETLGKRIKVKAASEEEAIEAATALWRDGKVVLGADDYVDSSFTVVSGE